MWEQYGWNSLARVENELGKSFATKLTSRPQLSNENASL